MPVETQAELNDVTTNASRHWATTRPEAFLTIGAIEAVAGAIGGAVLAVVGEVGAGVLIGALGVFIGAVTALPGWWSQRHPELAARTVEARRELARARFRRHPVAWAVFFPIAAAAFAALRWNSRVAGHHSHGLADWLVPAAIGWAVTAVAMNIAVRRARQS